MQSIPRTLVAADSRSQRAVVVGLLRAEGLDVHEADARHVALDLCRIARPDLLVLDLGLPRLQGWKVLSRVRADRKLGTMPMLVMTADEREDTVTAALKEARRTSSRSRRARPSCWRECAERFARKASLDQLAERNRLLSEAAEIDAPTGLPSRRASAKALAVAVARRAS